MNLHTQADRRGMEGQPGGYSDYYKPPRFLFAGMGVYIYGGCLAEQRSFYPKIGRRGFHF